MGLRWALKYSLEPKGGQLLRSDMLGLVSCFSHSKGDAEVIRTCLKPGVVVLIPALGKLKQEDFKFVASVSYMVRLALPPLLPLPLPAIGTCSGL